LIKFNETLSKLFSKSLDFNLSIIILKSN